MAEQYILLIIDLLDLFSKEHPVLFVALLLSAFLYLPSLIECAIEKLHQAWENVRLIFSMVPKDLQDWQPNNIQAKNIENTHTQDIAIAHKYPPAPQREVEVITTLAKQSKVRAAT